MLWRCQNARSLLSVSRHWGEARPASGFQGYRAGREGEWDRDDHLPQQPLWKFGIKNVYFGLMETLKEGTLSHGPNFQ